VITFPQGTTKSFKPVRKGTAHIIKQYKPIVVPIVMDGFRRSFDKKGLRMKKKDILQSFIIKPPLEIDYDNDTIEEIVEKIEELKTMTKSCFPAFVFYIKKKYPEIGKYVSSTVSPMIAIFKIIKNKRPLDKVLFN